ncbi:MAG: hypothetical protein EOO80_16085 [Oxalobacteraceae bacterium]|nr:MAG: hypothetical protein EOO80_16085 [Oxalobacteraceae bacterium]
MDDLKRFSGEVKCDRIKGQVTARLDTWTSNTPDLIKAAQAELARINCFAGNADGTMNDATRTGLTKYLSVKKRPTAEIKVTDTLVAELGKQAALTCPTVCPAGQTASGATCVAAKPAPAVAARPARQEEKPRKQAAPRREEPRQARREEPRREQPRQQTRQQASSGGGGRSGGGATMIGVGF